MKDSLLGAHLMALPSTSTCLGADWFETFSRSACLGWLCQTPCSYAGYLGVSTLHTFKINITLPSFIVDRFDHYRRPFHATHISRSCWVSSDTGHYRIEASLSSARLEGLPKVGPARLLAAMLGDLGVSTLRSIKTMTQFSSLFWASNQSCCPTWCSDTTLWVRPWRPLNFSSSIRSIESQLPIGRYSTSLRLARLQNRSAAKPICSFLDRWDNPPRKILYYLLKPIHFGH
jgi:hypothetical protein